MGMWDKKQNKLMIPMGKLSGVLYTILGLVGIFGFGIPMVLMTLLGYTVGARLVFHTIAWILFPLLAVSIALLINGNNIRKRLRRFEIYTNFINNRYYCLVADLAFATGESHRSTVRELEKMIQIGMFPEGHVDEKNVYFMLNDECYEEYLTLQQQAKIKLLEKESKTKAPSDQLNLEEQKVIDDGRALINEIKNVNSLIPGVDLSNKLHRLEIVTERIFEYAEAHPEKISQIQRLTSYFLPTTLKLADTYAKLDYQPVQGENILTAKSEIEKTMDTIYHAFETLLDELFEDVALDISTDISVLETIFAQEGLMKNSTQINNKLEEETNGE